MKYSQPNPGSPAWRQDISAFARWFCEKGIQVEPSCLVAFGIPIASRYGKATEIRCLLAFVERAALSGVAGYITRVFYDSKAGLCQYDLSDTAFHQPVVLETIRDCARMTLPQFEDHEGRYWYDGKEPD